MRDLEAIDFGVQLTFSRCPWNRNQLGSIVHDEQHPQREIVRCAPAKLMRSARIAFSSKGWFCSGLHYSRLRSLPQFVESFLHAKLTPLALLFSIQTNGLRS